MAAGTIRLDAEQMAFYAKRLVQMKEQLEELLKTLDECMARLSEEWAGDAYEQYSVQYSEIKTAYEATNEYIQKFSDVMLQTHANFVSVDTELAKAIKS